MKTIWGEPQRVSDGLYSVEIMPGGQISHAITEAIATAMTLDASVRFEFNGVTVTVRGDSHHHLVARDWERALSGYIAKEVGPYPAQTLTAEELANDAAVEAENEARRAASQSAYDAKMKAREDAANATLASGGAIELADADAWQKFKDANPDGYGGAVVSYAERWARLMQAGLRDGRTLAEIADNCSHEADVEGITGFMYGCAVSALAKCWKHGEELRRWHNLKTQLRDEGERANKSGGTLNPALLSIG